MNKAVAVLLEDSEAATAVEYAILIALIAVVIVIAAAALGQATNGLFGDPSLNAALQ